MHAVSAPTGTAGVARTVSHTCKAGHYEALLVSAGVLKDRNRAPRGRAKPAPLEDDHGIADVVDNALSNHACDDAAELATASSSSSPSSYSTSSSSSSGSEADDDGSDGAGDEGNGDGDEGDGDGISCDNVDEDSGMPSGVAFLRARYSRTPSSLNHEWGPFRFTLKRAGRRYSWQARCPFHRTSATVLCKLSMTIPVEGPEADMEAVNDVLRALKWWCLVAPDYSRRYTHHAFPVCVAGAPPDVVLNAQCPAEAPEQVLDDAELDALQQPGSELARVPEEAAQEEAGQAGDGEGSGSGHESDDDSESESS